jgi:hypothetical protein
MVLWSDVDVSLIDTTTVLKDRTKFKYKDGPLRFQIPRGVCTWGVSAYKSINVDLFNQEFISWWKSLEAQLCPQEPFNSNLRGPNSLRLKIDDSVYIFDQNSKQVTPEVREGLFRGQEVSCLIDIDSTYFFNGNWGLTVRVYQIKMLNEISEPSEQVSESSLQKGVCAFLTETDAS